MRQGVTTEVDGRRAFARAGAGRTACQPGERPWRTLGDYLDAVDRRGAAINFALFVGASNPREMVIGDVNRQPTAERDARDGGDRRSGHARRRDRPLDSSLIYVPAMYSTTEELIALWRASRRVRRRLLHAHARRRRSHRHGARRSIPHRPRGEASRSTSGTSRSAAARTGDGCRTSSSASPPRARKGSTSRRTSIRTPPRHWPLHARSRLGAGRRLRRASAKRLPIPTTAPASPKRLRAQVRQARRRAASTSRRSSTAAQDAVRKEVHRGDRGR